MKQSGVTLVETMATLAISSILLGMAVPGYGFLLNNIRLSGLTNDLVSVLNLARSEAVKRGIRVTVCKSANSTAPNPSCSQSGAWQQGWILFVDSGLPGQLDGGDHVLRSHEPSPLAAISSPYNFKDFISYMPTGVSQGGTGFSANGTLCVSLKGEYRKVILNNTGRIRLERKVC
jgi:type IV fimbrial biogenesis protein FimT